MTGIFFSDLDGTLVYSRARTPDWENIHVVERANGAPSSALRPAAWTLLTRMLGAGTLVPVTTRTADEFRRLTLPIAPAAIVSNGAEILIHRIPDEDWNRRIVNRRDPEAFRILADTVESLMEPSWGDKLLRRHDLFIVAVNHRGAEAPAGFDDAVRSLAEAHGYVVSRQHRKLYLTPAWLTKEAAAAHIADRLGADFTLAAGDATLDAGLLTWADEAMHPRHTADTLPGTPTTASGIDAGLELLTWAHTRIHGPADTTAVA